MNGKGDKDRTSNRKKYRKNYEKVFKKSKKATKVLSLLIVLQTPDTELDSIWDDQEWVEIENVAEEDIQHVDNVTAVAGVRGDRAEREILKYLYYKKSSKTRLKSSKRLQNNQMR